MGVSYSITEQRYWLRRVIIQSMCYQNRGLKMLLQREDIRNNKNISNISNNESLFEYYEVVISAGA